MSLSKTDYVTVHPANNVESLFPRDLDPAELDRVISLPETVEAPVTAGDKLGTMELRDGDKMCIRDRVCSGRWIWSRPSRRWRD